MQPGKKIRVAVLYGGRSGEHEISLQSAASVLRNLDPARFDVVPIGIDRQGRWHVTDPARMPSAGKVLPVFANAPQALLPAHPSGTTSTTLVAADSNTSSALAALPHTFDVVFPVVHGPLCEDGTLQGLLELADVPYVGCGVLASAVAMDKVIAKQLVAAAGVPVVPYQVVQHAAWQNQSLAVVSRLAAEVGFPCFVKPANLGSSVGIHKVKTAAGLEAAVSDAFRYDHKVLIEKAIDAREIEVALLDSADPTQPVQVSIPGEIVPHHEFYSYEAKYLDENGASLHIPAHLTPAQTHVVQELGQRAFSALACEGLARIDFFLDRRSGDWYFNEANTLPGFTSISMYPKLWEASGLSYRALLSHLVDLALARHQRKQSLLREYSANA